MEVFCLLGGLEKGFCTSHLDEWIANPFYRHFFGQVVCKMSSRSSHNSKCAITCPVTLVLLFSIPNSGGILTALSDSSINSLSRRQDVKTFLMVTF